VTGLGGLPAWGTAAADIAAGDVTAVDFAAAAEFAAAVLCGTPCAASRDHPRDLPPVPSMPACSSHLVRPCPCRRASRLDRPDRHRSSVLRA